MRKKRFIKRVNDFLNRFLLVLLVPLFFTVFYQKMQIEEMSGSTGTGELQLIGIVAKEIGAGAGEELLKAQAVIARTNLLAAQEAKTEEPEGFSQEEMRKLWGENFAQIYQRIENAVQETEGETLQYENKWIYAAYHALSAGTTRNMEELYPDAKMPYLCSVDCHEDSSAKDYLQVFYWEKEEFLKKCSEAYPQAEVTDVSQIFVTAKDQAGYVLKVQVGNETDTGEEFRKKIGLPSSDFTIAIRDEKVRIVTKGQGHGFGLSQYTAEKMAERGNGYEEILNYFFPGAKLKRESE